MRKGTVVYSAVLFLILGSAVALMPAGAYTEVGTAHFDSTKIDLNLPPPSIVKAMIRFESDSPNTTRF